LAFAQITPSGIYSGFNKSGHNTRLAIFMNSGLYKYGQFSPKNNLPESFKAINK
jgi:hypothetical protein